MAKFEAISTCSDVKLPERKTAESAGYDFFVQEDTLIPPYTILMDELSDYIGQQGAKSGTSFFDSLNEPRTINEIAAFTKATGIKPTLVPTGVKANLDLGTYLELSVRSSCPLKYWLIMANSVGIIDADYYNNPDNEGHIYFQMINLSPVPIILKKGDAIGQGIIKTYIKTEDDNSTASRLGGFGSTH